MKIRYREALNLALHEAMTEDPTVIVMGEEVASPQGGAFAVTGGLVDKFTERRVIDTPISENGFVGVAVGAATCGLRPVVEIMFADFLALAADQLINHAAKFHYMYDGSVKVPMVVRAACGGYRGYGATHSQFPASWFMNVPGLKIVAPFTPEDARWMLRWAINDNNPVLFLEHKLLYGLDGEVSPVSPMPENVSSKVIRRGEDVTVISFSFTLGMALDAAQELIEEDVSVEVIDLRCIKPIEISTILSSVKKTGRVVIVEEGPKTGGVGAEIAATIAESVLSFLDGRIIRVAGADTPIPSAINLEQAILPDKDQIVRACIASLNLD